VVLSKTSWSYAYLKIALLWLPVGCCIIELTGVICLEHTLRGNNQWEVCVEILIPVVQGGTKEGT